MCGIAGIHLREGHVSLARLRRMSEILQHRGPDDEGIVLLDPARRGHLTLAGIDTPQDVLASSLPFSPGKSAGNPVDAIYRVGLVHRRLSILDLSPTGHGPMSDRDAKLWITFNCEIYNFVELKQELKQLGHEFIGTSDTEVILAAYRQWGKACLRRFNGMFAFALWDADRRELFCARDRLGVKPFYYQWRANEFAFASEPKALVLTQEAPIRARLEAVRDLVALDWVDHRQGTFFEGVEQLPPGHSITIGPEGVRLERWWGLDPSRRATGSPVEWEHEFERLFTDSVRLRLLRADVEVGSCLSGGLDSSAVVTTAAMQHEKPVHTFTCAYDEGPAFDERSYVKLVAEKSGAISQVIVPTGDDFWEVFDHIAASQDEPTAGPGLYSQWKVMELARSAKLKVLLDGQGGDETLAGYWRYLPMRLRDLLAAGDFGSFTKLWPHVADRLGVQTTLGLVLEPWLPAASSIRCAGASARARTACSARRCASSRPCRAPSRPTRSRPPFRASSRSTPPSACCRRCSVTRIATAWRSASRRGCRSLTTGWSSTSSRCPTSRSSTARRASPSCGARSRTGFRRPCSSAATRWVSRPRPTSGSAGATRAR